MNGRKAKVLRDLAALVPKEMVMKQCQAMRQWANTNGRPQFRRINPLRQRKKIARRAMAAMGGFFNPMKPPTLEQP